MVSVQVPGVAGNIVKVDTHIEIVLVMYHDVIQVEGHDGHDQQVAHALQQLLLLRPQGDLSQLCQGNVAALASGDVDHSCANVSQVSNYTVSTKKLNSLFYGYNSLKSSPNSKRKVSFEICSF